MEIENLKSDWRNASEAINPDNGSGRRFSPGCKTSLDRLMLRYKGFAAMSATMTVLTGVLLIIASAESIEIPVPLWLWICFEAYFLTAAVMDYWLAYRIGAIDCTVMTVDDVLRKTMYCRKKHLQFIVILLPMALALFAGMIYSFNADMAIIYGMIAGFLIGLGIGLKKLSDFLKDYRRILD